MATLTIKVCNRATYIAYKTTFCDEEQALAWLQARAETHSFDVYWATDPAEQAAFDFPQDWHTLYTYLHPLCEHGLDASLCAGPQHYPYDDDELRGMGYWSASYWGR